MNAKTFLVAEVLVGRCGLEPEFGSYGSLSAVPGIPLAADLAEHPVLETIYRFKQRLCYLLLKKHRTRKQCKQLVPPFLRAV